MVAHPANLLAPCRGMQAHPHLTKWRGTMEKKAVNTTETATEHTESHE